MNIFNEKNYHSSNVYFYIVLFIFINYIASIIAEYIFYYFGLKKKDRDVKNAFKYCLFGNTVSYSLLLIVYVVIYQYYYT